MFTLSSRYALDLVSSMEAWMRKFASVLFSNLVLECKSAILNNNVDISRFVGLYVKSRG